LHLIGLGHCAVYTDFNDSRSNIELNRRKFELPWGDYGGSGFLSVNSPGFSHFVMGRLWGGVTGVTAHNGPF
jgi:hypothetical protein